MSYWYKNGQGSIVLRFKLLDSTSTTGGGLTGLTFSSTGLNISTIADNEATATVYTAAGSTIEAITTLGTFATPTTTKCRFKEVDASNHPGLYEFQFANTRYAVSNAKSILISVNGATNLAQSDIEIPLTSVDPYSANAFITGVNSLAPPTNWNLISIDGSGKLALTGTQAFNNTGNLTGNVTGSVGSVSGSVGSVTGAVGSVTSSVNTNANTTETAIKAKTDNLPSSPAAIGSVVTLDLTQAIPTSNTNQTLGDALNAARAQGFGKWVLSGTTLTLYAADGTTAVRTFTLDSSTTPTQRV